MWVVDEISCNLQALNYRALTDLRKVGKLHPPESALEVYTHASQFIWMRVGFAVPSASQAPGSLMNELIVFMHSNWNGLAV